ncbi:MAG TPA: hypothetical protein VMW48_00785 [Vicinamibacterales bacterium]|nr:hypothetical protein [Vicinamibacterales bacterium]
MAVADGSGTTVTFATSGFSMHITDVQGPSAERGEIETSYLGTSTWRTFIPEALANGGTVELTVQFDPSISDIITSAAETVTINWAGSGNTDAFSAFCTAFSRGARVGELMEGSMTLKVTGAIS